MLRNVSRCAEEMSVIVMSCQAQLTYLSIRGSDVTAPQSGSDCQTVRATRSSPSRHSVTGDYNTLRVTL